MVSQNLFSGNAAVVLFSPWRNPWESFREEQYRWVSSAAGQCRVEVAVPGGCLPLTLRGGYPQSWTEIRGFRPWCNSTPTSPTCPTQTVWLKLPSPFSVPRSQSCASVSLRSALFEISEVSASQQGLLCWGCSVSPTARGSSELSAVAWLSCSAQVCLNSPTSSDSPGASVW